MATNGSRNNANIPLDQPTSTNFWGPDSLTTSDDTSLDDIGVFQQNLASSDESGSAPTQTLQSASFDSKFSDSTDSNTVRLSHPQSLPQPSQTVISPQETALGVLDTPAIVSQDPVLADSCRRLFAKAPRSPTNQPDPPADSNNQVFPRILRPD
jgi:hypothetical protein